MTFTASLLKVCESYCAATDLSRGRLGTLVFNDGKAFERIAGGGDLNTRSYEKAMLWFSANWPEGLAWPDDVERPAAKPGTAPQPDEAAA